MKASNELCAAGETIGNLQECKAAILSLNRDGKNVYFKKTESAKNFPKGCYKYDWKQTGIWNTHKLGAAYVNAQPICKYGTKIELIIMSLLNVW